MSVEDGKFAAVVVGSGFGGSVAALTYWNLFREANAGKTPDTWERVCILERGQWWISHEIPATAKTDRDPGAARNMREFLQEEGRPFGNWAHPDNVKGLTALLAMARQVNPRGLYDFRSIGPDGKLTVFCASGVGGGSLIYSNVTVAPPDKVWQDWATEGPGSDLGKYLAPAESMIGTNPITTVAGLTGQKLQRSAMFHNAGQKLFDEMGLGLTGDLVVMNEHKVSGNKDKINTDLPLSITNIGTEVFTAPGPARDQVEKYRSPIQQNVCERQARCVLGCLPGARHTLNKRLFMALEKEPTLLPAEKTLEVRALCEAYRVTYDAVQEYPYAVEYLQRSEGAGAAQKHVRAKRLVLAGGTVGTNELLLKSAPGLELSDQRGGKFSNDGDLIAYMRLNQKSLDNTRGPINTSHVLIGKNENPGDPAHPKNRYVCSVEDTAFPPMVAPAFATFLEVDEEASGTGGGGWWARVRRRLRVLRRYPVLGFGMLFGGLDLHSLERLAAKLLKDKALRGIINRVVSKAPMTGAELRAPEPDDSRLERRLHKFLNSLFTNRDDPMASPAKRLERFFIFSIMGMDTAAGRLDLRPGWQQAEQAELANINAPPAEKLDLLDWTPASDEQSFQETLDGVRALAKRVEPTARVRAPTWDENDPEKRSLYVLHPLGGCRMGVNINDGVVDKYGRVFKKTRGDPMAVYPDFRIMDGSIVPGPLGINSSLTITALSLRCMEDAIKAELQLQERAALSNRDPREFWPINWASAVVDVAPVFAGTQAKAVPFKPFPDQVERVLPVVKVAQGAQHFPRAQYAQGLVVLWQVPPNPPPTTGLEPQIPMNLPVRPVKGATADITDDEAKAWPKGVVLWFV
jgi:choline dehydrogenase-like flavoprotein